MELFRQFNELGTTVIIASHDIGLIKSRRCQRCLLEGRIAGAAGGCPVRQSRKHGVLPTESQTMAGT